MVALFRGERGVVQSSQFVGAARPALDPVSPVGG
jgi:hypothetical protein